MEEVIANISVVSINVSGLPLIKRKNDQSGTEISVQLYSAYKICKNRIQKS